MRRGHAAVVELRDAMDAGRQQWLRRLGFTDGEAETAQPGTDVRGPRRSTRADAFLH